MASTALYAKIDKLEGGRPLARHLASDALRTILRYRLQLAGLPVEFATPHGLRAGFLTQAALDGAPLAAAMKLSLHRSAVQAQKYSADVEISENPAADLLGDLSVVSDADQPSDRYAVRF